MMDHFNRTYNNRAYQGGFTQSSQSNLESEGSERIQADEEDVEGSTTRNQTVRSSSTTDDETSSTSGSDNSSTEGLVDRGIDPLIDRAVLEYMINIRKRHKDTRAEFTDKLNKVAKIQHNEYFLERKEYKQELYDDPLSVYKPEVNLPTDYGKGYSDALSDIPLSRVVENSTSHQPYQDRLSRGLYDINPEAIKPSLLKDYNYDRPSNGEVYHLDRSNQDHEVTIPNLQSSVSPDDTSDSIRKKIWDDIVKIIPIVQRHVVASTKSRIAMAQRVSKLCNREMGKTVYRKLRVSRDAPMRARRATREMLTFWRRNEKEEREARKRAEREAMEKQRQEEEAREAKRQQKKLNFLITQTELYGHFIRKRLDNQPGEGPETKEEAALKDFDDINFDESDEELKKQAERSAHQALKLNDSRTKEFDNEAVERRKLADGENSLSPSAAIGEMNFQDPSTMQADSNITQPKMMTCTLKNYQIKGLNWLANLYEQGINGILADEMGLGKTVQSISMLAHLAENYNIWGPFMVIAPATTLHNWQQELTKFTPTLKVLPYWGSTRERKVLRQDWGKKQLYTRDAPFNVLITSYQLVISDASYLQRIKWQYMILDEAQAIKSSQSIRWKTLLKFHCRNRLLLTGTPIQNSMQELWSLLHFIMPSLFDSHDEFSDWFSRDIESHVENKGALDQHQIQRLHLILKPFMLRRIKKNVQHELADKIELEVKCQLTPRQRQLYRGLREKISLSELLEKSRSALDGDNIESLMNLVIQFRKVCNHPELFERAEVQSPLSLDTFPAPPPVGDFNYLPYNVTSRIKINVPRLFYHSQLLPPFNSANDSLFQLCKSQGSQFNLFSQQYIHTSSNQDGGCFGFIKLLGLLPTEVSKVYGLNLDTLANLNSYEEQHTHLDIYKLWSEGFDDSTSTSNLLRTMTPHSLIQSLKEHRDADSVATDFQLFARTMKVYNCYKPKATSTPANLYCSHTSHYQSQISALLNPVPRSVLLGRKIPQHQDGTGLISNPTLLDSSFPDNGLVGYSDTWIPATAKLILNSGKLLVLDKLLTQLKAEGHRVLIYFQMTKMIDIMEEFLTYRQYNYLRLDGSSRIEDRRDMVSDWQTRSDLFIFLLSTRAGGLGINLTAADTVIFYDSDWNPTVDQQAMDRAHRLGQTKQVTVYRLITQNTIEERILQRAQQKDAIHRVVIAGGDYKPPELKPKEIYSLLLDDDLDRPTTTTSQAQIQVDAVNSERRKLIEEVKHPNSEPNNTTTAPKMDVDDGIGAKRERDDGTNPTFTTTTDNDTDTHNGNQTVSSRRSNAYSVASLLTENLNEFEDPNKDHNTGDNRTTEHHRPPTSIADLLSPQDSTPDQVEDPIEPSKRFKSSPKDEASSFHN